MLPVSILLNWLNSSITNRNPWLEFWKTWLFGFDLDSTFLKIEFLISWFKISGFGCDTEAVINILAHRDATQRTLIQQEYRTMYSDDILKRLSSELSGKLEVQSSRFDFLKSNNLVFKFESLIFDKYWYYTDLYVFRSWILETFLCWKGQTAEVNFEFGKC